MKISTRGEYALRALILLGQHPNEVISISDISAKTLVPIRYLEQILLQLKSLGLIKSKRGAYGGYSLRIRTDEIYIGEVIRKLEGPLAPMHCVSLTAYEPCPLEKAGCLLQPLWSFIRDIVANVLDHTTLNQLISGNIKFSLYGGEAIGEKR
jgi:Rrf2 family protein